VDTSVKTDNYGRIIDKHTGRPLRDRRGRSPKGEPFHGRPGKKNRKSEVRVGGPVKRNVYGLAARIKDFDDNGVSGGSRKGDKWYRTPAGKVVQHHRPGSNKK
jgi:hypothetical protein